jgi:hypothetical protein
MNFAHGGDRAPNITTVIMGRFLCGVFGSTGSTMAGGSIADIWAPREYVTNGFGLQQAYLICIGAAST